MLTADQLSIYGKILEGALGGCSDVQLSTAVQEVSPVGLLTVVFCWAVLKSGSTGIPRPAFELKKAEDLFRLWVCRAVSAGL